MRPGRRAQVASAAPPPAPRSLSLRHPAMLVALVVGAACLVVSASYRLYDTDLWHLLAVGRALWNDPSALHRNLWAWPQYGEPSFVSSWAFRALLWPVWANGGVGALFVWRWTTTLAIFGLLFATARGMGARGFSAVAVLTWCSLDYRLRTDIRPEALASLLLAAQLWLLERQRRPGPEPARAARLTWWIPAIACAWANVHVSYPLGFALLGVYTLDAWWGDARGTAAGRARAHHLLRVAIAAGAASFVNPYGGAALWKPFEFALFWRNDPLFKAIGELQPVPWALALTNGQALWPALVLWRAARGRRDLAELVLCALFSALALSSLRFVATYALVSAPFVARDVQEILVLRRWPVPRFPLAVRAALTGAVCVGLCVSEWMRPDLPLGIGLDPATFPEHACDFMAAHGVTGRGFNQLHLGGYLPYRFWDDRGRLPFISTQPELTPAADRRLYVDAFLSQPGWQAIDGRYHFDWVLLDREQSGDDVLLDVLGRDTTWAMVFSDDAAELLVRRDRALRAVADSFAYRIVPAGRDGRLRLGVACEGLPVLRARAEADLDRMIASSPRNGGASHLRGWFALMDGDRVAARRHLERAIALRPLLPGVHERLGVIALDQGRLRDAIREFERERRHHTPPAGLFHEEGVAWQRLGDLGRARARYRAALAREPDFHPATDSLAALEARR